MMNNIVFTFEPENHFIEVTLDIEMEKSIHGIVELADTSYIITRFTHDDLSIVVDGAMDKVLIHSLLRAYDIDLLNEVIEYVNEHYHDEDTCGDDLANYEYEQEGDR